MLSDNLFFVNMETWQIIITVIVTHFFALISPGPDFLLIVRSALKNSRKNASGVVIGITLANAIYIVLCMIGVGSIIAQSLWLMYSIKVIGGSFLLYIAFSALKAKKSDYEFLSTPTLIERHQKPNSFLKEFSLGMLSGLSNPKNILFYLSLFSMVLTPNVSHGLAIGLGMWMIGLIFIWDIMIVMALSKPKVSRVFGRFAFYIDKLAGIFLGILGYKVFESAMKEGL